MSKLILLRHGQSVWNKLNLFTGWVDIPLSQDGIEEAVSAGKALANQNIDVIYVSSLVRSHMTAFIALAHSNSKKIPCRNHSEKDHLSEWYEQGAKDNPILIPVYEAWELNERMYGALQAKNKQQTREEYGDEQVHIWRRSYDVPPPGGESLEKTAERAIPFFEKNIVEDLKSGKDVFVCAHGNSLRSIVMDIDKLSKEQVLELEIATGVPIIYEYEQGSFQKVAK
jgi:2,3-bisphosphoglycerate-dependent phosphoglycerate mutase